MWTSISKDPEGIYQSSTHELVSNVLRKEVLRLFISHQHGGLKGPYLIALHVEQMDSAFDLFNPKTLINAAKSFARSQLKGWYNFLSF